MQRSFENALAELALGPAIAPGDTASIEAWLERHGFDDRQARALRRDFPRLLVYRDLVRGTLREALEACMPRGLRRLGPHFEPYFDEFLRGAPLETPYLRDVTPAFLAYALPRMAEDPRIPAYLPDLLRHEALQVEIASLLGRPKHDLAPELALDRSVSFIDAVRRVDYAFAVHRLPEDPDDTREPEAARVQLLVYRSPEHEVRYLELSALAACLLDRLIEQRCTLGDALLGATSELSVACTPGVIEGTARLLADLAERGALLGSPGQGAGPQSSAGSA